MSKQLLVCEICEEIIYPFNGCECGLEFTSYGGTDADEDADYSHLRRGDKKEPNGQE